MVLFLIALNHFQPDVSDRFQQFFQVFGVVIECRTDSDGILDAHRTEKRNNRQKQLIQIDRKQYSKGAE